MARETLPNTAFIHVNRQNRPRTTDKIDGFQKTEPKPKVRSTSYETVSPLNLRAHEYENLSYAPSYFSNLNHHPKRDFYPHCPICFNVSQSIYGLGTPSYQLPSYPGPQNDALPLSPTVAEQQYDYKSHNTSGWWLPDWGLRENNYPYPLKTAYGVYSPAWDMRYEPKQQTSPYLPSQYSTKNNHPTCRATAPHTSLDASAFMRNKCKISQTMDNTNENSSHLPLHPHVRPQIAASLISAKDSTRRNRLSKTTKNKIPVSTNQQKNRQFEDPSGHPLREATLENEHKRMYKTTQLENITENNGNARDYEPGKIKDYTGHKSGTYKTRQSKPDFHVPERRKNTTTDGDELYNGGPHPLTKDALAKLNKEHGDDIESKVQGICRANSSRSTIFDEGGSTAGNRGKGGKY